MNIAAAAAIEIRHHQGLGVMHSNHELKPEYWWIEMNFH